MSVHNSEEPHKGYALFDLDQTLVPWDMQLLYGNWIMQRVPLTRIGMLPFYLALPLHKILGARRMKRLFLIPTSFLKDSRRAALDRQFVEHYFPKLFYPKLRERLVEHQRNGDCVILTSASPMLYVRHIGELLGVDKTFGTEVTWRRSFFCVPTIRVNNKGEQKIRRLKKWLEQEALPHTFPLLNSTAYTDSTADLPLIRACERAVLVNPSERLIQSTSVPYEIERPKRPSSSRLVLYFHVLLMLLGGYPISSTKTEPSEI